jgi:hypothetical protein
VIGVDHTGDGRDLREQGADLIIHDLTELLRDRPEASG